MSHDIGWAVQQMREGKKVRRRCWPYNWCYQLHYGDVFDEQSKPAKAMYCSAHATDWELYEPEPEGHTLEWVGKQALGQYPKAIRARRKEWPAGEYMTTGLTSGVFILRQGLESQLFSPTPYDVVATDWILAEEPK